MYNSKYKNRKNKNTSFPKAKEESQIKTYTTTARLYLREEPSKDKAAITIIPKDT